MPDKTIVLATSNKGKISEIKELLKGFDIRIKSLLDFDPIPPVVEDGETFEDNAYKKASFTAKALGFPSLADDSGLVVEALGGAPGVYSSRYAGDNASDQDRIIKLLMEMRGKADRRAYFESVIVIAVPSGPAFIYKGRCEGLITDEPKGNYGFGYDPVFYYPPLDRTFAQMSGEEKNRVSHRGKAMTKLRDEFDKVMIWLSQQSTRSREL
jgi:XTP/dITP diphosphohydrolase